MNSIEKKKLLKAIEDNKVSLSSSNEALFLMIHLIMIEDGFKCIESNDDKDIKEQIPNNWNKNKDYFTMKYQHEKSKNTFLIKAINMGNQLIIHALIVEKPDNPYGMQLKVTDFVDMKNVKDFDKLFKEIDSLVKIIRMNVTFKFIPSLQPTQNNQNNNNLNEYQSNFQPYDPLRVNPRPVRRRQPNNQFGIPNIGQDDLNPFGNFQIGGRGGGGGGMFFGPNNFPGPGRRFPGSHPQGARFDPFFGEPDDDHFQPPGTGGSGSGNGSDSGSGSGWLPL